MARKVFFSFHYQRDVRRVAQVRNSWVVRGAKESQPFFDKADWETVKRTGIENWIENQLKGSSVTVVLIGAQTASRPWVRHEIMRSHELRKGMIGVRIHNVRDPQLGTDVVGTNPLSVAKLVTSSSSQDLSGLYPTYDWILHDGRANLSKWIEQAAVSAGR